MVSRRSIDSASSFTKALEYFMPSVDSWPLIPLIHGMTKLEDTLFSIWAISVASSKGDRISTKSLSVFRSYAANLAVSRAFNFS